MSSISRRRFLMSAAVAAAGLSTFNLGCASSGKMTTNNRYKIGTQLYPFRHGLEQDFPGMLARVAATGVQGVEFADYFGRTAEQLRAELDKNNLQCCGNHIYLEDLMGSKFEETVAFNKVLGNKYLIVRFLPEERRNTKEAFLKTVADFADVAERLKPHGMHIGYHNHDYIFNRFDGQYLWNILADNTPREVTLQLDTGNATVAGADPLVLLARNPGRTHTIHLKPFSKAKPEALIGEDDLDWKAILELCKDTGGTEWFILEYEVEGPDPLVALSANYQRLQSMLT